MGYLTVLYISLGAKIRDLHAKDSNAFRKRLIVSFQLPVASSTRRMFTSSQAAIPFAY